MMDAAVHFGRKYAKLLSISWSETIAYRSEGLIWIVGAVMQPAVALAVWLTISQSGAVQGFGAGDYVVYFLGVMVIGRLTSSWDVWELERDIREGSFSAKLLRPFHPVHWSIAYNLVFKLFSLLILVPLWLIIAAIWPLARLEAGIEQLALAGLAVLGAAAIRFLIGYEFGLFAFWTQRASALYLMYEGVHLFLAGRIAPLSMFPEWFVSGVKWLPFYMTVGFPVDLLTGRFAGRPDDVAFFFALQAGWFVFFLVLFRLIWRNGLKQYGAVGG